MPKRLTDSVEEQTHANSSTENHCEIGCIGEFRLVLLLTKLDVPIAVGHPDDEEGEDRISNCESANVRIRNREVRK